MKKLNKIMVIFTIAIMSSIVFISCNNEDSESKYSNNINKSMTELGLYNIYNQNNPFDIFGVRHNLYLNSLGIKLYNTAGIEFYKNANYNLSDLMSNVINSEIQDNGSSYTQKDLDDLKSIADNPSDFISKILSDNTNNKYLILDDDFSYMNYYDNNVAIYYEQIKNLFIDCFNENITMNQFFEDITRIENNVLFSESYHNNYEELIQDSISNTDALLIYISILKHSLVYWNNAAISTDNVWHGAIIYLLANIDEVYSATIHKGIFSWLKKGWENFKKYISGEKWSYAVVQGILPVTSMDAAGGLVGTYLGGFIGGVTGSSIASAIGVIYGTTKHQ